MALISTTFTPVAGYFPYTGIADVARTERSAIPRAEVVFSQIDGAVTLSGAGDTQRININMSLPRNYAYALVDANMAVTGADATQWLSVATMAVFNDLAAVTQKVHLQGVSEGVVNLAADLRRAYGFSLLTKQIIKPVVGSTSSVFSQVQLSNNTAEQVAMEVDFSSVGSSLTSTKLCTGQLTKQCWLGSGLQAIYVDDMVVSCALHLKQRFSRLVEPLCSPHSLSS